MLLQNDPFRDIDHVFSRLAPRGAKQLSMPLDAYRRGDAVWVHADLPGVATETIDISVERNVLTVTAEREWHTEEGDQLYMNERSTGSYRRQVHLGDGLDPDGIEAKYTDGVLTLRIPVAEVAKPRKIIVDVNRGATDIG